MIALTFGLGLVALAGARLYSHCKKWPQRVRCRYDFLGTVSPRLK